ncbi:acyl-CoA dehydratase activase [candidate division CSSED10-310 bacterium]|uniref:Acyl-CoA dehydratase activase n=1 Tax=candidate division CSSED10-310 bacterium TaxID=2855610 RepID=A0ABV6Z3P2_UNCC1
MEVSLYAGVDVGSSNTKVVLLDSKCNLKGIAVDRSGVDFAEASENTFGAALDDAGSTREQVQYIISTGYGRKNVSFANKTMTEIACHARGAYFHFSQAITVVDIGGQDNKIMKLAEDGTRLDFKMNRKCAAGTGAFIEEMAYRAGVPLGDMEKLARKSTVDIVIGSFCTVFSATEVLALIRKGVKLPDIAKGAFRSVVKRIVEMDPLSGQVVTTGGVVAHHPYVAELLSEAIQRQVKIPPQPQLSGALGAALYAIEEYTNKNLK